MNQDIYCIENTYRAEIRERYLSDHEQQVKRLKRLLWLRYSSPEDLGDIDLEIEKIELEMKWHFLSYDMELNHEELPNAEVIDFQSINEPSKQPFDHDSYLNQLKEKIFSEFRRQKARKLYATADFIYWRCQAYGRALIGYQLIMDKIGCGDKQSREYLKWLRDEGYIKISGKHAQDVKPREYKWNA